ncbi:MAG TPA: hypothetical protein VF623_12555 [Segetibacter sp.]
MKKVFIIVPAAMMLVNCSTSRNATTTSTNNTSGTTASANVSSGTTGIDATASGTGTTATNATTGSMGTAAAMGTAGPSGTGTRNTMSSASATGSYSTGTSAAVGNKYSSDVYDPTNFMQNPEKYKTPVQLGAPGGWTYNKDWRRNTNFATDAVGLWQLSLTPDVLAYIKPDTSRPETYASYWTPEAMLRHSMMAVTPNNSGDSTNATASATPSADMSGTSMSATGSGTTGAVGTGGAALTTTTTDTAAGASPVNILTAVNGNNFVLPTLNLFIENGSFTGYTGSNNLAGSVMMNGNSVRFQNLIPSSAFTGTGGFDQSAYIDRLSRADSYDVVNGQIRLKQGEQVLLVLTKVGQ